MRKRIRPNTTSFCIGGGQWLDVTQLALVEVTSEDPAYPIESALMPGLSSGWRAADGGQQTIRLLFDKPLRISRILLEFEEKEQPRAQEFLLGWRQSNATEDREIVRQQYNFSPEGAQQEIE